MLQTHCRVCTGNVARLVTSVPIGSNSIGRNEVLECLKFLVIYTHVCTTRTKRYRLQCKVNLLIIGSSLCRNKHYLTVCRVVYSSCTVVART